MGTTPMIHQTGQNGVHVITVPDRLHTLEMFGLKPDKHRLAPSRFWRLRQRFLGVLRRQVPVLWQTTASRRRATALRIAKQNLHVDVWCCYVSLWQCGSYLGDSGRIHLVTNVSACGLRALATWGNVREPCMILHKFGWTARRALKPCIIDVVWKVYIATL